MGSEPHVAEITAAYGANGLLLSLADGIDCWKVEAVVYGLFCHFWTSKKFLNCFAVPGSLLAAIHTPLISAYLFIFCYLAFLTLPHLNFV